MTSGVSYPFLLIVVGFKLDTNVTGEILGRMEV